MASFCTFFRDQNLGPLKKSVPRRFPFTTRKSNPFPSFPTPVSKRVSRCNIHVKLLLCPVSLNCLFDMVANSSVKNLRLCKWLLSCKMVGRINKSPLTLLTKYLLVLKNIGFINVKVARLSIFVGVLSIFESLRLKQTYLYCKTFITHVLHTD